MNLLDLFIRIGAKDEASDTIEDVSGKAIPNLAKAASTAAKALAGMWAVKKIGEFGKAAFDAYSQFQQLEGGAQKIFDEVDQSKILDDANDAWKNLNMSANEYLAAINQTGAMFAQTMGDEKGYETAKAGMQAISDYATGTGRDINELNSKFSAITRSTSSYQSIADQFAGILPATSKDFLEQAQAAGILSENYEQLTDVPVAEYQEAVTKMLEKGVDALGLTGNTAREALGTLSGSIMSAKSAWQNLVAEFGKPDADIGARISDMMTALLGENGEGGLVRNVVNEVGVIASNMIGAVSDGIQAAIDWLIDEGPTRFQEALSALVETVSAWATSLLENPIDLAEMFKLEDGEVGLIDRLKAMGSSIADTIKTYGPQLVTATGTLFSTIGQTIVDNIPFVLDTVGGLLADIGSYIIENGPELAASAYEALLTVFETILEGGSEMVDSLDGLLENVVTTITDFLVNHGPDILAAAIRLFSNIATAIANNTPTIMAKIGELIGKLVGFVLSSAGKMLQAGIKFVGGLLDGSTKQGAAVRTWFANLPTMLLNALGYVGNLLTSAGKSIIQGFWDGLKSKFDDVKGWVGGIGTWLQEHKGPREYDLGLLVDNGKWVMQSLENGLRLGYKGVQKFVGEIGDDLQAGFKTDVSIDAHNIAGRLAPSTSQKSVAGDTYNVYLSVEDRNDFDGMALAFVDAVAERNRLAGRSSTMNVRYE